MAYAEIESPLVLTPDWNGALLTPEEFDAVEECDEDHVYELVNGVLIVTPPPLEGERMPNDELGYLLRLYRDHHPHGKALDETAYEQTVPTGRNRRRADRVIWCGLGRKPDPEKDAPAIVIEYVSKGRRNRRRDFIEKKKEYVGAGVKEYWIIDRFRRQMTVFRGDGNELVVSEKDKYTTALLPGFELDFAKLLAVADQYGN